MKKKCTIRLRSESETCVAKLSAGGRANLEEYKEFINLIKKELAPSKESFIEAVVDAAKVIIKDDALDAPSKFYSLLV
jgi:hypothetical protein